ncbi:MAG: class I SAM-dependent methyltransferase [Candidatus Omnitrophota bacterium]
MEHNKIWKKELTHLAIYKLKNNARETVVVNLKGSDSFKLDDVLFCELFASRDLKIDYSFFKDELLRCIYPAESREYRYYKYCESLLNFYLNNYAAKKDDCSTAQFSLDMYKYAINHIRGNSVLDAGSCAAIFPILLKLKMPANEVTASDCNCGYFDDFAVQYCKQNGINIKFKKLDILSPSTEESYDTVTSIHTLEHFEEKDTAAVINNLLKITNKRLIMIFPFEDFITIKDHRQKLNHKKINMIIKNLRFPAKIEKVSARNYALAIDTDR